MLNSNWIVLLTLVGGLLGGVILCTYTGRRLNTFFVPGDIGLSLFANALTLSTIACFLYNILISVVGRAIWGIVASATAGQVNTHDAGMLTMDGNEITVFFAFSYAFVMICGATRRTILAACNTSAASATSAPAA